MIIESNNVKDLKVHDWAILWGSPKTWAGFFDDAKRVRARFFTGLFRQISVTEPTIKASTLHYSVIASKKNVSKSSVTRHRAKRRLKSAVLEVARTLDLPSSPKALQWVLLADRKSIEAPWPLLCEDIKKALNTVILEAKGAD